MLSGVLAENDKQELERHIEGCAACRAELALQREMDVALSVEAHSGLSPDFAAQVSARALRMSAKAKVSRPWPVLVPPMAAAAAAAALFFMVMNLSGGESTAFEQVANGLVRPVSWFAGLFAGLMEGLESYAASLDPRMSSGAGLTAAFLACVITAYWGLRRFLVYLR
jgi:anti-sigma factor RsiW